MKKGLFLAGFGFLPLWTAIVLMVIGGLKASPTSEYWTAAPWMIVVAIPLTLVTLVIAAITLLVESRTAGSQSRKTKYATVSFLALVLTVSAIAIALSN